MTSSFLREEVYFLMNTPAVVRPLPRDAAGTSDSGTIHLGAAMRHPAAADPAPAKVAAAEVADSGRIRLGAAMHAPGHRHG